MRLGRGAVATGQHEGVQAGQLAVDAVDGRLDALDGLGCDAALDPEVGLGGVGGQIGADGEEFVLHEAERVERLGIVRLGHEQADVRIELVDGAIGFEPRMGLGHAKAAHECGGAFVATAGVDDTFLHFVLFLR